MSNFLSRLISGGGWGDDDDSLDYDVLGDGGGDVDYGDLGNGSDLDYGALGLGNGNNGNNAGGFGDLTVDDPNGSAHWGGWGNGAGAGLTPDSSPRVPDAIRLPEADSGPDPYKYPSSEGYAARQGVGDNSSIGASQGALGQVLQGLRLANKEGKIDFSDPATMDRLLRVVSTGGNLLYGLSGRGRNQGRSIQQLRQEFNSPFNTWTPQQSASAGAYFNGPVAGPRQLRMPSSTASIVPGRRYAEGGEVETMDLPFGEQVDDAAPEFHSEGALASLVSGEGGGQDDMVPARLGSGEYVFDAATVADIGDGSNEYGAEILDRWREEIRRHKRSAPPSEIPPRALPPEDYLRAALTEE